MYGNAGQLVQAGAVIGHVACHLLRPNAVNLPAPGDHPLGQVDDMPADAAIDVARDEQQPARPVIGQR